MVNSAPSPLSVSSISPQTPPSSSSPGRRQQSSENKLVPPKVFAPGKDAPLPTVRLTAFSFASPAFHVCVDFQFFASLISSALYSLTPGLLCSHVLVVPSDSNGTSGL